MTSLLSPWQVLTYPVIYIRGGRLAGGYTELRALADGADGVGRVLSRLGLDVG